MSNVYGFRSGRSVKGCNPQDVGQELERIRAEKGKLTPEFVVETAQAEESPLHTAFTWDDNEAARLHRLNEARRLITSIRVLNAPVNGPVTAFISVRTPDKGRSYVPTIEAMTEEQLRIRVLTEARTFIESLERRYSHLVEVGNLLDRLKQAVA